MKKRRCIAAGLILSSVLTLGCTAKESHSIDYMAAIQQSVSVGDFDTAKLYESARNQKIKELGLNYDTTDFFSEKNVTKVHENIQNYVQNGCKVSPTQPEYVRYFSDNDVVMLAKVAYCEARGIKSKTEIACVMWTILNRYDAGYAKSISAVILSPSQFAYRSSAPMVSDYGYDLYALAYDVLENWSKEHSGRTDVVRVLPKEFMWYAGNGVSNRFRCHYRCGHYYQYYLGYYYDA